MACLHNKLRITGSQDGAVAIIVALSLAMLLGFAALAIDVGYMYTTRNELQNVADAAALAGAGKLGSIYSAMDIVELQNYQLTNDEKTAIMQAAKDMAALNKAASENITINDADITISKWNFNDSPDQNLSENLINADAVRVIARRDTGSAEGAVATFFAKILTLFGGNTDTFQVSAVATAALSGPSTLNEGEMNLPIGISKNNACGDTITFSGTKDSCAGWHNFFNKVTSTSKMRDMQLGLISGHSVDQSDTDIISDLTASGDRDGLGNIITDGATWLNEHFSTTEDATVVEDIDLNDSDKDSFNFLGGEASLMESVLLEWTGENNDQTATVTGTGQIAAFPALFDYFRMRDGDGDNSVWTATVPIYDDGDTCSNPSGFTKLVGFGVVKVLSYSGPPQNSVTVMLDCNSFVINEGRGGGGQFGTLKGSIPNLVQ